MLRKFFAFLFITYSITFEGISANTSSIGVVSCPTLTRALMGGMPLTAVPNPKEFIKVDKRTALAATERVHQYGFYRTNPTKFKEQDTVQGGFHYTSSELSLWDRWRFINRGKLLNENVLDAYLHDADRLALVPKILNQEDDATAGSVVMSPAGIYTHLHIDPVTHNPKKYVSCGAWMYLLNGKKKFFFVHRRVVAQTLRDGKFTIEDLRRMSIAQLDRAFKGNAATFLLAPYNLILFRGSEYFHAVETGQSPALGISGFYGYS